MVKILGFSDCLLQILNLPLSCKENINSTETNQHGCVKMKLYLKTQVTGPI